MSAPRGWHLLASADLPAEVTAAQVAQVTGLSTLTVTKQLSASRWGVAPVVDRYGPHGARFYRLADVLACVAGGVVRGRSRKGDGAGSGGQMP